MLHNYYTLRAVAHDLDRSLRHGHIRAAFSQNRNELAVAWTDKPTLVISCEPAANFLSLRETFPRAKRNTIDVFPALEGAILRDVSIQPSDREVDLSFEDGRHLLIQLFGSRANVFLTDAKRKILAAFLRPDEYLQATVQVSPERSVAPASVQELDTRLHAVGHLPASSVLRKIYPLFGSLLIRELLFQSSIPEQATAVEISGSQIGKLFETGQQLDQRLRGEPSPRIYSDGQAPVAFAILPLEHLSDLDVRTFPSIHQAIGTFVGSSHRRKSLLSEKDAIVGSLLKEKEKIERTLGKMTQETGDGERSETYELFGKVLLAYAADLRKGLTVAALTNLFSPDKEQLEIPLDPHLTPVKNAERYFDKARKARHAREEHAARKQEYHERYDLIQTLLERAEPIQNLEAWKEFVEDRRENLQALGLLRTTKGEPAPRSPFRTFVVEGGFEVWAGKNSENNDLLTMKHARPGDLWFHARGGSGSHVVLKTSSAKGEVPKKAIQQAASIAAFYSKLKNSRLVPVAMTERKYVRKPRGAPAGTVTIEREKVLMVEPRLPQ